MTTNEEILKTEARIQSECFQWFNNEFPLLRGLLYHVPNGGKKSKIEAGQLLAMGVVAGIPDLCFHFHKKTFFLECKTPSGTASPDQKRIHKKFDEHGFLTWIFRSLEEFQAIIWSILHDKSPYYEPARTRKQWVYKNSVFMYIYEMEFGDVYDVSLLTNDPDKFRQIVFEFMNDGFDKIEGFEILFLPDYSGFYKKEIERETRVFSPEGYSAINIPTKNE